MKNFNYHSLTICLGLLGASSTFSIAHAQLMFSQYVDGSSNRKGLEIYNPDATTVNLADYEIQQFNNGGTVKTAESVSCSSADTPIANLAQSTQNQNYTIRGVITADYRYSNGFSGFYIQTPDSKATPNVSNAIFVYIPASSAVKGGQIGDEVILRGRLTNYQNQLQIDQLQQDIQTCNQNMASLIQPLDLNLPFTSLTENTGNTPKRYQGMLVKLPQTLTVSENYNFGRYGELSLSLGRLFIPTNLYPALSNEAKALAQQNLLSKIIFDDGYNNQNRAPWLPQNFSALNTLRSGYQLKNAQGILEYRFNAWRVQPIAGVNLPEVVTTTNPRTTIAVCQ